MDNGAGEMGSGAARRAMLAWLGAVVTAYDAAEETFDRFVKRGEQVEAELRGKAEDVRRENAGARHRVQQSAQTMMDVMLNRMGLPSKADVETINVKLNILARKLDDLQMEQVQEAKAESQPPSPPSSAT